MQLGLALTSLYAEIRRRKGEPPIEVPPVTEWPLHLRSTTPLNYAALRALPVVNAIVHRSLDAAWDYMKPEKFDYFSTSRTIKATKLTAQDLVQALGRGKFERVAQDYESHLPRGVHGVNVFTVPEMKGADG